MEPIKDTPNKKRRTRTNVKQSKFGCFTCKKRKVKCDEAKPSCQRCLSHSLTCAGYPRGAPPGSLVKSLQSRPSQGLGHLRSRHSHLACIIFHQGPQKAKSKFEVTFWRHTVPQLIDSNPFVAAAAAAFGASFEEHMLRPSTACLGLGAMQKYCRALQMVQQEVSCLRHGTLPCIVACLLLAFTEVLQHCTGQAYLHVQGAFALMTHSDANTRASTDEDGLSTLFEKLDLHSAIYIQSSSSDPASLYSTPPRLTSPPADRSLSRLLRACYHFTSRASRYRYVSPLFIPHELFIEQGRELGGLQQWLLLNRPSTRSLVVDAEDQHLLVLRAQCLAGLIRCATILTPGETSYDSYAMQFQEIVASAEAFLESQRKFNDCQILPASLPSFTPEMGIIQPLFFTAKKHRHPFWRRKALNLLKSCGREGPWCGTIEGAALEVMIEAEEGVPFSTSLGMYEFDQYAAQQPGIVPERQRIHSCWMVGHQDQGSGGRARSIQVQLRKCRDLEAVLNVNKSEPDEEFRQNQTYWDTWEETVLLPE